MLAQSSVASDQMGHNVRREVEIQSKLRHPNIVSMPCFFQDSKTIYFVLDYAPGGDVYKVPCITLDRVAIQDRGAHLDIQNKFRAFSGPDFFFFFLY